MDSLHFDYGSKTIQEFTLLFEHGQLNLNPGFQRNSVWTLPDRKKLIESLLQNYPVPSIFLYRQSNNGKLCYDVIDGKQRLETVLRFQAIKSFRKDRFGVKLKLNRTANSAEEWNWSKLQKNGFEDRLTAYKFQTVEIAGDLSDIIHLFVLINSTGRRLTTAEKRHARFFHSEFLKKASHLAESKRSFFLEHRILSSGQMSRMKHVELICELLVSIQAKGLIDKKRALDGVMAGHPVDAKKIAISVQEVVRILNLVKRVFPNFGATRFRNSTDFYSLFMAIWEIDNNGLILSDAKRNHEAQELLSKLDAGTAEVRQQQREVKGASTDQRMFAEYLLAVQSDTDSLAQRQRRHEILKKMFSGLFEQRDEKRGFNIEQRRILWNSDERKRCTNCKAQLSWTNFTVDHTKPHALGGRTSLSNASLMCRPCNSKFGKRPKNMPLK